MRKAWEIFEVSTFDSCMAMEYKYPAMKQRMKLPFVSGYMPSDEQVRSRELL